MNVLKKKVKLIIGIVLRIILVSGISIGATVTYLYNASEVKYNDDKSVAEVLDDLYANQFRSKESYGCGKFFKKVISFLSYILFFFGFCYIITNNVK